MPVLLTCHEIGKSFGARRLFDGLSITISDGERIGVIGPNGSGKSTLAQILSGLIEPDSGTRSLRKLTRLAYVPQDSVFPDGQSVREVLDTSVAALPLDEDEKRARVEMMLGKAGFEDPAQHASALSGGWRKRLAIASAAVQFPDLLLLDEPTNHLDLDGIIWLERLLTGSAAACLVISHDRYFLENVATRMVEISRLYPDGLFSVDGAYGRFLERKADFLAAQEKQQEALATKVRREREWLSRGPKARTGKSRARIDAAGRLIAELADVTGRSATGTAQIEFTASDRKTKKLIVAESIGKEFGGRLLFRDLNLTLSPGLRLGLVGGNGSGKSTLLRLIEGTLKADAGTIQRADNLRVVFFEQNRDTLDAASTLRRALCPEGDSVIYRGRPIHVAGWAKRFLFRAEQLDQPVGSLSGGERARVLIAMLMLEPADVLLLDEPTNDLDIPTLEVLEENLLDFPGALVLVTHDRYMLDRVSTAVLGLDGEGRAVIFADYSQWEQWRGEKRSEKPGREAPVGKPAQSAKRKLSYLEQREFESMENLILEGEAALVSKQEALHDAAITSDGALLQQRYLELQEAQEEVDRLYARWAELEAKAG